MIVYVETNFLLELVFLQKGCEDCEQLLELAGSKAIELVLPAFCLGETYETLIRRKKKRVKFVETLNTEIKEMARSEPYKDFSEKTDELRTAMLESVDKEEERLEQVLQKVLFNAEIISLDAAILKSALHYQSQESLGLPPQDSMVYASVIKHLTEEAPDTDKCFLTLNSNDFVDPDVKDELENYKCKLLFKFSTGLNYVRHMVTHSEPPFEGDEL